MEANAAMPNDAFRKRVFELASRWLPSLRDAAHLRIHTDTTDFFDIQYGDVVILEGVPYLIRQNAKEGRFGLDDEEKFWVKRAINLEDSTRKIIKLVFHERFTATIGNLQYECFRSPRKEARILSIVADHPHFMHGLSTIDSQGNIVRILDHIYGHTLADHVERLQIDHERYFQEVFPSILERYMESIRAIGTLHRHGEKHGDVRRDHIIIDGETGCYRWIDFDYNYRHRENIFGYDLFGLGNILMFLVGKGDVIVSEGHRDARNPVSGIQDGDVNIVFNNRLANLKKRYPYIPDALNRILLHFSRGSRYFYEQTEQLLEDLESYRANRNLSAG